MCGKYGDSDVGVIEILYKEKFCLIFGNFDGVFILVKVGIVCGMGIELFLSLIFLVDGFFLCLGSRCLIVIFFVIYIFGLFIDMFFFLIIDLIVCLISVFWGIGIVVEIGVFLDMLLLMGLDLILIFLVVICFFGVYLWNMGFYIFGFMIVFLGFLIGLFLEFLFFVDFLIMFLFECFVFRIFDLIFELFVLLKILFFFVGEDVFDVDLWESGLSLFLLLVGVEMFFFLCIWLCIVDFFLGDFFGDFSFLWLVVSLYCNEVDLNLDCILLWGFFFCWIFVDIGFVCMFWIIL